MNIKEFRKLTGLSQKDFGSRYDIPHRTIQSWETEQRSCPEYVENLLERVVLEDCGKKVGYVFSWMTEHAGDDKFFSSKSEAMKEADKEWKYATKSEKKEYVRFEVFKIICTAKEWDELIECETDYTASDRMEVMVKDFLHVYTKEEFIQEALKGNGVQNDSGEVWVSVDGNNYSVSVDDVLGRDEKEPFEASVYLESNLDSPAWDDLYELYREDKR